MSDLLARRTRGLSKVSVAVMAQTGGGARPSGLKAWCNICFIDSRRYDTIVLVLNEIENVRDALGESPLVFMLTFVEQRVSLWVDVIHRKYGGMPNVSHCHCPKGQSVLYFGSPKGDVALHAVQCMEPPPDLGVTKYTDPILYLELTFHYAQCQTKNIAVVWVPGLFCTNGYLINEEAYQGAMGFIKATIAFHRATKLSSEREMVEHADYADIKKACSVVQEHLSGMMLMINMRSDYFSGAWPIWTRHTAGFMHAVIGTVHDRKFEDSMESERLCTWPACCRVRVTKKQYHVPHHCVEFWDPLFQTVSRPQIESEAVCSAEKKLMIELPCDERSDHEAGQVEESVASFECMICLTRAPTFVFKECGHFGVCGPCRKYMCKHEYSQGKTSKPVAPAEVTMKKVGSLNVRCPLCTRRTPMVYKDAFRGRVYHS